MLIYPEEKEWMRDKKVWLEGWSIPFDLFFFVPNLEHREIYISMLETDGWRGDTENITPPILRIIRRFNYPDGYKEVRRW